LSHSLRTNINSYFHYPKNLKGVEKASNIAWSNICNFGLKA